LYIEQEDFHGSPSETVFFRLAPERESAPQVRLFYRCESVVKALDSGEIAEIHCTYDPATRGGDSPEWRKVKATLHWVSAERSIRQWCASMTACL